MPTVPQQYSTTTSGHLPVPSSSRGSLPAEETQSAPALLHVYECPPYDLSGGILIARLLDGYPQDRLHVLAGSYMLKRFGGRLACHHISFPQTTHTGRWGLGRLKHLLELALLPVLALYCWRVIRRYRIEAVLTIAQNFYCIAAAAGAYLSRLPLIVVVHDDWPFLMRSPIGMPQAASRWLYRRMMRSASHIYAVSPGMQQALRDDYGVESEVQLPASDAPPATAGPSGAPGTLRVVFAGTLNFATIPGIELLVKALKSPALSEVTWSLDFYGATPQDLRRYGWDDERMHAHGWTPQERLHAALRAADVLYLPYSFDPAQSRFMQTSFPSKLADYLSAGKPLLICAPPESTVMAYAQGGGFAEVVDRPSENLVSAALVRLSALPDHRQRLGARAVQVFAENHDIVRQREDLRRVVAVLAHDRNPQVARVRVEHKSISKIS